MMPSRVFTLALLVAIAGLANAQTFTTPKKISGTTPAHSPMLQTARNGDLYVAWYANAADIYFARSTDGGMTFTAPIRVASQVTSNIYTSLLQRTPRFVVDKNGTIHMVWTEERLNGQNDIWYVRSTDRGDTWTLPRSIMDPDDSATYPQDFCNIACDSNGALYVAYLDFRGVVRGTMDYAQLHFTKSVDGGVMWSMPVVANKFKDGIGGTCECCKLDIAVTPSGTVNIAFRSNIDNKRDVWLARSRDGGATFDSTIHVQTGTWTVPGCPTTGPSIALDRSNNLYLAWRDSRDDSGKAISYFASVGENQTTVTTNRQVSRVGLQNVNWPSLALYDSGIAYVYQAGSSSRARFRYSTDRGTNWTQDIPFPDPANAEQSLATLAFTADGRLFAAWQEGSNSGSIMVAEVTQLPRPSVILPIQVKIEPDTIEVGDPLRLRWNRPSNDVPYSYTVDILNLAGVTVLSRTVPNDTTLVIDPNPIQAGTWSVVITSDPGSYKSEAMPLVVLPKSAVNQHDEPVSIWQDPSGIVRWQGIDLESVSLFDLKGACLFVGPATGSAFRLPKDLPKGAYMVRLTGKALSRSLPVIVQ